jgi:hypothetical protein
MKQAFTRHVLCVTAEVCVKSHHVYQETEQAETRNSCLGEFSQNTPLNIMKCANFYEKLIKPNTLK